MTDRSIKEWEEKLAALGEMAAWLVIYVALGGWLIMLCRGFC